MSKFLKRPKYSVITNFDYAINEVTPISYD